MGNLISLQTAYQGLIKCLPIFLTLFPTVLATVRLFLSVPSCPKPFTLAFPSDVKVLRSLYDWLFLIIWDSVSNC